jgi:hypothetical protein
MTYYTSLVPDSTDTLPNAWRRMFGIMIQDAREFIGRSVEEAAK